MKKLFLLVTVTLYVATANAQDTIKYDVGGRPLTYEGEIKRAANNGIAAGVFTMLGGAGFIAGSLITQPIGIDEKKQESQAKLSRNIYIASAGCILISGMQLTIAFTHLKNAQQLKNKNLVFNLTNDGIGLAYKF